MFSYFMEDNNVHPSNVRRKICNFSLNILLLHIVTIF